MAAIFISILFCLAFLVQDSFVSVADAQPNELYVSYDTTQRTYRDFIDSWRRSVSTSIFTHQVPLLIPRQNPPVRTFDVVLRTARSAITLRIRADDLYLMGYQVEGQDRWYEFNMENGRHLIPESTFLPFSGDYSSMVGDGRDQIALGRQPLETAVNNIAYSTGNLGRSLTIVIQMICEAIRFTNISDHLYDNFGSSLPAPSWMVALENNWGALSEGLRRLDADPSAQFLPPHNVLGFTMPYQATAVLGVALYYCFPSSNIAEIRARPRRMADGQCTASGRQHEEVYQVCINNIDGESPGDLYGMADEQCTTFGRPLAEVYQVRINNIDGESPGDLYGKITVTDGLLGSRYMYYIERSYAQSVYPGDFVLLTGPAQAIEAGDSFSIEMALMDRDSFPDLTPDDEVSKGKFFWNFFNGANVYDSVNSLEIEGEYGSATVYYVVFSSAVTATIEVKLINGDGEDPADVYGSIGAKNTNFQYYESTLFKKGSDEHVDVRPGELIPLSRSAVAVPSSSSLKITANLWDHDVISSDDQIADGSADFLVQLSGTSQKSITGDYGEIQVKVTWA